MQNENHFMNIWDDKKYHLQIEVLNFDILKPYNKVKKIRKKDMLLSFDDIERNFKDVMQNWFKSQGKLRSFYYLYFINRYTQKKYPEGILIEYTQALESYMRQNDEFNGEYLTKKKYEPIEKKLNKYLKGLNLEKDHTDSLKSRIHYGYEYSLRKRLTNLLNNFQKIPFIKYIVDDNITDFVDTVVKTRNYYTHYSKESESDAKKGQDLYILNERLKIIIEICFLNELGLNNSEIENIVNKYQHYHQIINLYY